LLLISYILSFKAASIYNEDDQVDDKYDNDNNRNNNNNNNSSIHMKKNNSFSSRTSEAKRIPSTKLLATEPLDSLLPESCAATVTEPSGLCDASLMSTIN